DPPELAAGALPAAGDRLRGGSRTEPPARDGPQPPFLGDGAHRGPRLRATARTAQRRIPAAVVRVAGRADTSHRALHCCVGAKVSAAGKQRKLRSWVTG